MPAGWQKKVQGVSLFISFFRNRHIESFPRIRDTSMLASPRFRWLLAGLCLFAALFAAMLYERPLTSAERAALYTTLPPANDIPARPSERPDQPEGEDAVGRMHFEYMRLRDPRTGRLPQDFRDRELALAATLPTRESMAGKAAGLLAATWAARGPYNVGGRTRALAVDLNYNGTSNRRILAGGVSGGVFLSEDDGATWRMTSSIDEFASVTALAQDPNNRNVWYHGTGEFIANSAGATGAEHYGQGLFKSTDGGQSWQRLPTPAANNQYHVFDDFFDFIWNVKVHPQGSVVLAASYGGIWRSTDGGNTWQMVLGRNQQPFSRATDVAIAADGSVYATLSRSGGGQAEYGVYRSTNQGQSWTNITPSALSNDPHRLVLATAPSDANTVYVLTQANDKGEKVEDHQLLRYNAGTNGWTNLSANLPKVTQPDGQGNPPVDGINQFNSQGGYDLVVAVKPDNPNVVWIGGSNLYRSSNGGQSWEQVGGYVNAYRIALYPNQHPDQHVIAFYPNSANTMLSGHDGGISKTTNAVQSPQQWTLLNNGYTTSQFYAIAMDPGGGSDLLVGGTQDNGTWLTEQTSATQAWNEMMGGDGAFAAVEPGAGALYTSSQNGFILRIRPLNNQLSYSIVAPASAQGYLFIAPFALDPSNGKVMYLAAGHQVWRNSNLDGIAEGNAQNTDQNWTPLSTSAVGTINSHRVTAVAATKVPAGRLYFGATNFNNETRIIRVDNPAGNGAGTNITPPVTGGAYPSSIAVNPANGDEIIATFSNYNVESVWHSTNGGQSWQSVEGNLGGASGPSVRWAAIQPVAGGTAYLLATSTGVYSANSLSGAQTTWVQEGANVIGNVVTNMIVARDDGTVVAATHGRGVYSAKLSAGGGGGQAVASLSLSEVALSVRPGQSASAAVDLRNLGTAPLSFTAGAVCTGNEAFDGGGTLSSFVLARPPRQWSATAKTPARAVPARGAQGNTLSSLTDYFTLDDGNATPDDFIGYPGSSFFWGNRFDLGGDAFTLEGIEFYMRTENETSNPVSLSIYDFNGNAIASGDLTYAASANGQWYRATLSNPIAFNAGQSFSVEIGASSAIQFPAGADRNGVVTGHSYYYDYSQFTYVSLATISGFSNGAFLIRAFGTKPGGGGGGGGQNQPPNAVATLSATQARVGEAITFNASSSSDPDGQIVSYLWQFGDGQTSNQAVVTRSYAQPGSYTVTLTVTDNQGATGQATGQVTVTPAQQTGCALAVSPASGTVAPGGTQRLTVSFNAANLGAGTYRGRIDVGGNGGPVSVPVRVTVASNVSRDDAPQLPAQARLAQNYPNPFNPTTTIPYELHVPGRVAVSVYDALGRRVRVLYAGTRAAGQHEVRWDGRDAAGRSLPSGLYLYRLDVWPQGGGASLSLTQRMMLLK